MNFTQLVKTLIDYLDLGKRIATTIPGMVLALGFVLAFSDPPDVLRKAETLERQVQELNELLQDVQAEKEILLRKREQVDFELKNAESWLAIEQRAYTQAEQAWQKSPTVDARNAFKQAQEDLYKAKFKGERATLVARQKSLQHRIAALEAEIVRLETKRNAIATRADQSREFSSSLQRAFYDIILFGLLGFAIGTVLDPLNKALFLQTLPNWGKGAAASPARRYLSGYSTLKASADKAISGQINAEKRLEMNPHFFIGRGLLSAAEYDEFISSYYRYAEISTGMVIPTFILAIGLAKRNSSELGGVGISVVVICGALIGFGLFQVGMRRYGEFKSKVSDFIAGRETAFKAESARLPEHQIEILAESVTRLENAIKRLNEQQQK